MSDRLDPSAITEATLGSATVDEATSALVRVLAERLEAGVALYDSAGKTLASAGMLKTPPAMSMALRGRRRLLGHLMIDRELESPPARAFAEAGRSAAAQLLLEREAERGQNPLISERLLRTVLDLLPVGVVVVGRDGTFAIANEAAQRMTGRAPAVVSLLRPSNLPSILRDAETYAPMPLGDTPLRLALNTGQETRGLTSVLESPDGEDRVVRVSAGPLREGDAIVGAVAVVADITAEHALRRVLLESLACGVVIHDAHGALLTANEAVARILEVRSAADVAKHFEEFAGQWRPGARPPWELLRQSNAVSVTAAIDCATATGRPLSLEATSRCLRRPDGALDQVVTTFIDNTAVHRAWLALEESEERFRAVFEQTAIGIAILDQQGRVVSSNRALRRFLRPLALDGTAFVDLLDPTLRDQPVASLQRLFGGDEGNAGGEFRFRGEPERWGFVTVTGVRTASGAGRFLVATVADISERKRAERQLETIGQAEKLRALGQMASGVAHDLNQYLGLVSGHGELALSELEREAPDVARIREALSTIVQAALDGADTVRRLQAFARSRPEGPSKRVDLPELIREVAKLTAPQWRDAAQQEGRPIALYLESDADAVIDGWPESLREAFTNLVFNAVDALPHGGTIRMVVRRQGDEAEVTVADDGVGMSPKVQARIFEPFFTTKGDHGSGLGLSIVFRTVERHRGRIAVDSAPGRGTAFRLTFPIAEPVSSSLAAARSERELQPLDILAVDDDPALATMLKMMLERDGHQVAVAASAEQALLFLETRPFDLVISDLGLGTGMNGWDLAAQVQQRFPQTRVALATGWGAEIDPVEARARGVSGVVAKPYRTADLRQLIAAAFESV